MKFVHKLNSHSLWPCSNAVTSHGTKFEESSKCADWPFTKICIVGNFHITMYSGI